MRKLITIVLALSMLLSMSVTAFAAEDHLGDGKTQTTIVINADYVSGSEGLYRTDVKNNSATIVAGDVSVSVSGAPASAKFLEVYIVPASQTEALNWMDSRISEHGTLSHAYIVSLVDANGNKTAANGETVKITCSHCNGDEIVVGLNTNGESVQITASNGSFTANGSAYYIVAEKKSGTTVTVPVRGDENEIHADVTINDDTVELHELDFDEIDHIVGDHVNTGIVEIDLTELNEDITKIELPMASIKHIVEAAEEAHNDTEALQIDFPNGSVKLDDKTLRAIIDTVGEEATVDLVLESVGTDRLNDAQDKALEDAKVYGGFEAYLICNNTGVRVSDFKGGVATLSVPFEVPGGLKAEKFSVWYVADDGKIEKLDTHYANGHLVWNVGHFSDFIIVYEGEETPDKPDAPQTGDNSKLWLWWLLLIVSATGVVVLWNEQRKRKAVK